jgi:hypothetical protein
VSPLSLSLSPATSGLESPSFGKADVLANHMGLFLQKTNIIRDYLVGDGRGAGGGVSTVLCVSIFIVCFVLGCAEVEWDGVGWGGDGEVEAWAL